MTECHCSNSINPLHMQICQLIVLCLPLNNSLQSAVFGPQSPQSVLNGLQWRAVLALSARLIYQFGQIQDANYYLGRSICHLVLFAFQASERICNYCDNLLPLHQWTALNKMVNAKPPILQMQSAPVLAHQSNCSVCITNFQYSVVSLIRFQQIICILFLIKTIIIFQNIMF